MAAQPLLDRGLEYAEDFLHGQRQAQERVGDPDERLFFALEAVSQARKQLMPDVAK